MSFTVRQIDILRARTCIAVFALLFCIQFSARADWPTYMNDNTRSGITSETLELSELNQGWVYTAPTPPQIAWDGGQPWDSYAGVTQVPMRDFDFVFFVTVVGDRLYLGSSVTNSVHCLDVRSGQQQWFFTTDGPVRYPPSFYDDKLYFGSDDGFVYCINANDGSFVWKYSPSQSTRLIGNNNNLISMWPVRTGTAVSNGRVYFAASLVSWQTSYLCSVDAATGSDSGTGLYKVSGGITPMAAIMTSPTKIYLLQGRLYPYVFNKDNGALLGTVGDYGDGGCYALLTSDSRMAHGLGQNKQSGDEVREWNADTLATAGSHANGRRLIVSGTTGYLLTNTSLLAINRSNSQTTWSVACDCNNSLILADDVLFAGGTNEVAAYSITDGSEVWNKPVNGRARGLAASNGRLYVSTDTGSIYMFGSIHLAADFDGSGEVGLTDLLMLVEDYLKCTDPVGTGCEDVSE